MLTKNIQISLKASGILQKLNDLYIYRSQLFSPLFLTRSDFLSRKYSVNKYDYSAQKKDADEKPTNIKDLKWLSKLRECWLIEMLHIKFHCYLHLYYMLNLWKLMFASFSFDVQPSMEQDLIFSDFVLKINLIKEKTTFSENCPSHPNFYKHFDTLRCMVTQFIE